MLIDVYGFLEVGVLDWDGLVKGVAIKDQPASSNKVENLSTSRLRARKNRFEKYTALSCF